MGSQSHVTRIEIFVDDVLRRTTPEDVVVDFAQRLDLRENLRSVVRDRDQRRFDFAFGLSSHVFIFLPQRRYAQPPNQPMSTPNAILSKGTIT